MATKLPSVPGVEFETVKGRSGYVCYISVRGPHVEMDTNGGATLDGVFTPEQLEAIAAEMRRLRREGKS